MTNTDIIHLQHSHITQYTNDGGKTAWKVRKNITSEDLAELPGNLTEDEVFKVMEFAREFELIAFNEGTRFGKKTMRDILDPFITNLQKELQIIRGENERLSTTLEKFILSGVEI